MQHTRTNQGGSVGAFIIVGVLLTGALVGGVYFVHQRGKQNSALPSTSQSPKQPQNQPKAPQPSTSQPQPTGSSQIPTGSVSKSSPLPATGPANTAIQLVAAGLLTLMAVAYMQSRRRQSRIAL